jgi:hypothetical protein
MRFAGADSPHIVASADLSESTRGVDDVVHGEMNLRSLPDSNTLTTDNWVRREDARSPTGSIHYYEGPPEQIEIFSDGDVYIRLVQKNGNASDQFVHALLLGYAVAQEVFYRFGLRSEALFYVIARFGPTES